jgi:hypothetical protein
MTEFENFRGAAIRMDDINLPRCGATTAFGAHMRAVGLFRRSLPGIPVW